MAIFADSTTHGDLLVADIQVLGQYFGKSHCGSFSGREKTPFRNYILFWFFQPLQVNVEGILERMGWCHSSNPGGANVLVSCVTSWVQYLHHSLGARV